MTCLHANKLSSKQLRNQCHPAKAQCWNNGVFLQNFQCSRDA